MASSSDLLRRQKDSFEASERVTRCPRSACSSSRANAVEIALRYMAPEESSELRWAIIISCLSAGSICFPMMVHSSSFAPGFVLL